MDEARDQRKEWGHHGTDEWSFTMDFIDCKYGQDLILYFIAIHTPSLFFSSLRRLFLHLSLMQKHLTIPTLNTVRDPEAQITQQGWCLNIHSFCYLIGAKNYCFNCGRMRSEKKTELDLFLKLYICLAWRPNNITACYGSKGFSGAGKQKLAGCLSHHRQTGPHITQSIPHLAQLDFVAQYLFSYKYYKLKFHSFYSSICN